MTRPLPEAQNVGWTREWAVREDLQKRLAPAIEAGHHQTDYRALRLSGEGLAAYANARAARYAHGSEHEQWLRPQ